MSDDEDSVGSPVHELKDEGDICGDGSIMKEIITPGSGFQKPPKGAEVSVHYVGTLLDGTKFDSRGEYFKFSLGTGGVIKGWDEGVATMLKGEKSKFTIKSDKAYGPRGSPPKIPPNATLVFEIELFSWVSEEDVSEKKDGSILKETVKTGEGYRTPSELGSVDIHYTLSLEDGTTIKTTRTGEGAAPQTAVIDDGTLLEGLETALKKMKKGEVAKLTIAPQHAFGAAGNAELKVPANATITAEVELVDFRNEKDAYDLEPAEKLAQADRIREMGNEYFKKGDYARAERRYTKSLSYADSEYKMSDEQKAQAKAKKVLAHINVAAALLKEHKYKEARESCNKALEVDAANVKGLFRRGTALLELGEWDDARKDLKRALELDPGNAAAQQSLKTLNERVAKQAESDKKRYKGMFERLSKLETKDEEERKRAAAAKTAADAPAAAAEPVGASEEKQAASGDAAQPAPMES